MEPHGTLWDPMGPHGSLFMGPHEWHPMGPDGSAMGPHGSPWDPMGSHADSNPFFNGCPWDPKGSPWDPMGPHGDSNPIFVSGADFIFCNRIRATKLPGAMSYSVLPSSTLSCAALPCPALPRRGLTLATVTNTFLTGSGQPWSDPGGNPAY